MPVLDHETHPSTIHNNMRYTKCQNKVRALWYGVMTRHYLNDGSYELRYEWILDTSSPGCRNVSFDTDPACQGCKQVRDMEYINRMKALCS